jgi:hypothetical protein
MDPSFGRAGRARRPCGWTFLLAGLGGRSGAGTETRLPTSERVDYSLLGSARRWPVCRRGGHITTRRRGRVRDLLQHRSLCGCACAARGCDKSRPLLPGRAHSYSPALESHRGRVAAGACRRSRAGPAPEHQRSGPLPIHTHFMYAWPESPSLGTGPIEPNGSICNCQRSGPDHTWRVVVPTSLPST